MEAMFARLTVGEVRAMIEGKDPDMKFADLLTGPPSSPPARKASEPINEKGGFVTKQPHFEVSDGGLTLKKVGRDGQWNTARIKPGMGVGSRRYIEFYLKKLKKAVNQQIVIGLTLENMPADNFLGSNAFSWGYGTKYGHVYHKGADIPYAEQAKQGDTIGILMSGPAMFVYKNGKEMGRACDLHGTGNAYHAVSLMHDGDTVVIKHVDL